MASGADAFRCGITSYSEEVPIGITIDKRGETANILRKVMRASHTRVESNASCEYRRGIKHIYRLQNNISFIAHIWQSGQVPVR
jgi:hypothetical protein